MMRILLKMAPKKSKSQKKENDPIIVFRKEKVVGTFMIAGLVSVFLAFYKLLVEFFYMPSALAFFVIALLFFLLALMFNVAEAK